MFTFLFQGSEWVSSRVIHDENKARRSVPLKVSLQEQVGDDSSDFSIR